MATKPTDLLPSWGTAGVYGASNYQDPLPWGDPNPLGGGPTPWSGGSRLDATGLTAFAASGLEPELPTPAESFNEWLRRCGDYITSWVAAGTSAADADAHIVETNASGLISAQALETTVGVFGVGSTPVILLHGADIPTTKTLTIATAATLQFAGTGLLDGVSGTIAKIGTLELISGAPAPGSRQLSAGTGGELSWNPGTGGEFVHYSPNGWVYATGDQEAETVTAATTFVATTIQSVVGIGLGNVRVIVEGWGQRSIAGQVTIDVQQDQGTSTWIDIGANQAIDWVDSSDADIWSYFRHERTLNAGTSTAIFYRAKITAGGGNTAKVRETYLRVVNERA